LPTRPEHLGRHYDKRSISNFGVHCDIGCEYRISYRVGVSYTFYALRRLLPTPGHPKPHPHPDGRQRRPAVLFLK